MSTSTKIVKKGNLVHRDIFTIRCILYILYNISWFHLSLVTKLHNCYNYNNVSINI